MHATAPARHPVQAEACPSLLCSALLFFSSGVSPFIASIIATRHTPKPTGCGSVGARQPRQRARAQLATARARSRQPAAPVGPVAVACEARARPRTAPAPPARARWLLVLFLDNFGPVRTACAKNADEVGVGSGFQACRVRRQWDLCGGRSGAKRRAERADCVQPGPLNAALATPQLDRAV